MRFEYRFAQRARLEAKKARRALRRGERERERERKKERAIAGGNRTVVRRRHDDDSWRIYDVMIVPRAEILFPSRSGHLRCGESLIKQAVGETISSLARSTVAHSRLFHSRSAPRLPTKEAEEEERSPLCMRLVVPRDVSAQQTDRASRRVQLPMQPTDRSTVLGTLCVHVHAIVELVVAVEASVECRLSTESKSRA